MMYDDYEKELLELEKNDLLPFRKPTAKERADLIQSAEMTLKKNKRINIRLADNDLQALKELAHKKGMPYQTLIASVLHRYTIGNLAETVRS